MNINTENFTRKNIFIASFWIIILLALIWAFLLNQPRSWWWKIPKELNIWVVWDETAWFEDISKWFKEKYKEYKNTNIKFTKFSSYKDYEDTLTKVYSDGSSPDIFVINSNWWKILEDKISLVPTNIINPTDFSKSFNKVFDWLIYDQFEELQKWKKTRVTWLKWVPMWYETLWIYYNWDLIQKVPETWEEINSLSSEWSEDYSPIGIGLWSDYTDSLEEIIPLFAIQNWYDSYKSIWKDWWKLLDSYINIYSSNWTNSFLSQKSEMLPWETNNIDLFARWKVWMIIWYPSTLKKIELATKRAWWYNTLDDKNLRTDLIPQITSNKKDFKNLANFNYFAASRIWKYKDASFKFIWYLATEEAQKKYLDNFPWYLPAVKSAEDYRLKQKMSTNYSRIDYTSFSVNDDTQLKIFDKWLKTYFDSYISKNFINFDNLDSNKYNDTISSLINFIDCNEKHLIEKTNFETECK